MPASGPAPVVVSNIDRWHRADCCYAVQKFPPSCEDYVSCGSHEVHTWSAPGAFAYTPTTVQGPGTLTIDLNAVPSVDTIVPN